MASVCLSSRATAGSVTAQRVVTRRGSTVRAMRCSAASTSAASAKVDAMSAEQLKRQILRLGALTDRGQLLFPQKAYAPLDLYNAGHKEDIVEAVEALAKTKEGTPVDPALMNGEWECVLATKQIFRSSPFFMAIQDAFGDATFGDSKSSEVFFRLHDLQVMSWGASTVGRVAQRIDMDNETMESDFDTILFRSTVIPILGWFKLLPTFGGRVVSFADRVKLDPESGRIDLELQKTRVERKEGIPEPPLFLPWFLDRDYPVNAVWKLLPWNKGRAPTATTYVKYVDEDFRVMVDRDGQYFVYCKVA